jgi:hypothetical protein
MDYNNYDFGYSNLLCTLCQGFQFKYELILSYSLLTLSLSLSFLNLCRVYLKHPVYNIKPLIMFIGHVSVLFDHHQ